MKTYPLAIATSLLLAFGGAVYAQGTQQQAPAQGGGQSAPAAPGGAQGQAPQGGGDQAQAMPEPEPASSKQVSSCNRVATKIMKSLSKEDFKAASATFDDNLKSMLSEDTLKEGWGSLTDEFGKPGKVSKATEGQRIQDFTVVLLPMDFEKAKVGAQVACNDDNEASSLRIGVISEEGGQGGQPAQNGS